MFYLKKSSAFITLLLLFGLAGAPEAFGTEDYAAATGQECSVCHLDPAGGGELTEVGNGYALSLGLAGAAERTVHQRSFASRGLQVLVGYLHIFFGFFWFGTILYVHLVLKPGYASRGLPRGEVKLGLVSMVVMGVTGAVLFAYRVPDPSVLLDTRFGVLLLLKIILYLIMVFSALFAVFVLGPRLRNKQAVANPSGTGDLSLEELAQHDGKEGRTAYFAYKGDIYDVTQSSKWKNGTHMGRHFAGGDLTELLGQAPHGENLVLAMPKVGQLKPAAPPRMTPPQKLFYTMAYMNLGLVFLIVLILALWKWL